MASVQLRYVQRAQSRAGVLTTAAQLALSLVRPHDHVIVMEVRFCCGQLGVRMSNLCGLTDRGLDPERPHDSGLAADQPHTADSATSGVSG
jgi:hypothetical protein